MIHCKSIRTYFYLYKIHHQSINNYTDLHNSNTFNNKIVKIIFCRMNKFIFVNSLLNKLSSSMNNKSEKKLKLVITKQAQHMAIFPNMDQLPDFTDNQYPVSKVYI